jgi:hypothetical protein
MSIEYTGQNIKVGADNHCGSPIELLTIAQYKTKVMWFERNGVLYIDLGDNVDLAGAEENDLGELKQLRLWLLEKLGKRYRDGNHGRVEPRDKYYRINDDLFGHGDEIKWGKKKSMKYRAKPHGASKFKRKFIIPLIEWAEQFGVNRVTRKMKKNVRKLLIEKGCTTYHCGHVHVKELTIVDLGNGLTLKVYPRGFSDVKLGSEN